MQAGEIIKPVARAGDAGRLALTAAARALESARRGQRLPRIADDGDWPALFYPASPVDIRARFEAAPKEPADA